MIDISGLDKALVLMALFNASRQQGLGFMDSTGAVDMTIEDAREIVGSGRSYFDYLRGRVMKVDISGNQLNPAMYDRDNGEGAAARVIDSIRA